MKWAHTRTEKNSDQGGNWTHDFQVRSPLLYRLSYKVILEQVLGTEDFKVTAMNMYNYKEGLRFCKRWPCSTYIWTDNIPSLRSTSGNSVCTSTTNVQRSYSNACAVGPTACDPLTLQGCFPKYWETTEPWKIQIYVLLEACTKVTSDLVTFHEEDNVHLWVCAQNLPIEYAVDQILPKGDRPRWSTAISLYLLYIDCYYYPGCKNCCLYPQCQRQCCC